jgi:hypothetical protein
MGHRSDPTFRVLHVMKLKGFADAAAIAELTGMTVADIDQHLAAAADAGLARRRDGRVIGWALTADGRSRHADLLAVDRQLSAGDEVVAGVYGEFAELNGRFKEVCTDWQLRTLGGDGGDGRDQVPNDHRDAAYDKVVISALMAIDDHAQPICGHLGQALERMAGYGPRLTRALGRVLAGDRDGFTRPLNDSYHDVWMELHEDLITTLGVARTTADA